MYAFLYNLELASCFLVFLFDFKVFLFFDVEVTFKVFEVDDARKRNCGHFVEYPRKK